MPEWKRYVVKVELEFRVVGSESDGTAVDLIAEAVGALGEMKVLRSDGGGDPGEVGMYVKPPAAKSITVIH